MKRSRYKLMIADHLLPPGNHGNVPASSGTTPCSSNPRGKGKVPEQNWGAESQQEGNEADRDESPLGHLAQVVPEGQLPLLGNEAPGSYEASYRKYLEQQSQDTASTAEGSAMANDGDGKVVLNLQLVPEATTRGTHMYKVTTRRALVQFRDAPRVFEHSDWSTKLRERKIIPACRLLALAIVYKIWRLSRAINAGEDAAMPVAAVTSTSLPIAVAECETSDSVTADTSDATIVKETAAMPSTPHWCVIDIDRINALLGKTHCPHCQCENTVHVTTGEHKGFALHLTLRCSKCHSELGSAFSSPVLATGTNPQPFAINDIMVLLFNRLGLGYTAMKEFCGILGIPGMHLKTFQEKEKKVISKTVEVINAVLQQSADVVRAMHQATNPGDEEEEEDSVRCKL
ncbi:hypothetical protein LSAT2_022910 [Lamellibrachia satsuma]|nr:hypothetical protein LSAT2_022910 [Lamellibrachia satsuma]